MVRNYAHSDGGELLRDCGSDAEVSPLDPSIEGSHHQHEFDLRNRGITLLGSSYSASKFALEGFSDSLRKEMLDFGVSVSLINPGFVTSAIKDKIISSIPSFADNPTTKLYRSHLSGYDQALEYGFAAGDDTRVTDSALLHSLLAAKPSTRYFVSNVNGHSSWFLAFLVRVVPTNLLDRIQSRWL